ncbi:MAG: transcriptional repressor [Acetobacter sp.]|uniref:transcriptional repressor n=1 Tax=Acetobacter sp. TaxID=440 RepID=UPI0039ECD1F6
MQPVLQRRRTSPDIRQICQDGEADYPLFRDLKARCQRAGMKMTNPRCLVLLGCIRAVPGATAAEVWQSTMALAKGHALSYGSLQRSLNAFVQHGILLRDIGPERAWRYRIAATAQRAPTVNLIDNDTGQQTSCKAPEMSRILQKIADEHGFMMRDACIIITWERRPDNG